MTTALSSQASPVEILIADPTSWGCTAAERLSAYGFAPMLAVSAADAMALFSRSGASRVVVELRLRGQSTGFDLLRALSQTERAPHVVVVTAYGSVPLALAALRRGARDFLVKPVPVEQVVAALGLDCGGVRSAERGAWMSLKSARASYIAEILAEYGTISATAKALGLDRKSLRRMLGRERRHAALRPSGAGS